MMANQLLPFVNAVKSGLESQSPVELAKCLSDPKAGVFKPDAFTGTAKTSAGILEELQGAVRAVDASVTVRLPTPCPQLQITDVNHRDVFSQLKPVLAF